VSESSKPQIPGIPPEPSNNSIAGLNPWSVLQTAVKAVPALRYALAVLGIVAAIAIVKGFGIDYRVAVFGTIVMVVLMVSLVVFAALTTVKSQQTRAAALVMMWSFLVLAILSVILLFTSAFFDFPKPLPHLSGLGQDVQINNNNSKPLASLSTLPTSHSGIPIKDEHDLNPKGKIDSLKGNIESGSPKAKPSVLANKPELLIDSPPDSQIVYAISKSSQGGRVVITGRCTGLSQKNIIDLHVMEHVNNKSYPQNHLMITPDSEGRWRGSVHVGNTPMQGQKFTVTASTTENGELVQSKPHSFTLIDPMPLTEDQP
jgi:hypothetical protein